MNISKWRTKVIHCITVQLFFGKQRNEYLKCDLNNAANCQDYTTSKIQEWIWSIGGMKLTGKAKVLKGKPALMLILPSKSDTGWPGINSFKTHSFCEKFSEASGWNYSHSHNLINVYLDSDDWFRNHSNINSCIQYSKQLHVISILFHKPFMLC